MPTRQRRGQARALDAGRVRGGRPVRVAPRRPARRLDRPDPAGPGAVHLLRRRPGLRRRPRADVPGLLRRQHPRGAEPDARRSCATRRSRRPTPSSPGRRRSSSSSAASSRWSPASATSCPELRDADDLDFDVLPMPTIDTRATVGDISGLCISADSEVTGDAADFIAYAVSDAAIATVASTGYIVPANTEVAASRRTSSPRRRAGQRRRSSTRASATWWCRRSSTSARSSSRRSPRCSSGSSPPPACSTSSRRPRRSTRPRRRSSSPEETESPTESPTESTRPSHPSESSRLDRPARRSAPRIAPTSAPVTSPACQGRAPYDASWARTASASSAGSRVAGGAHISRRR